MTDQSKAHAFYTEELGFVTKLDFPAGEFRYLTVVSPQQPDGTQILLEPNDNPVASTYQKGLYEAGLPCAVLSTSDIAAEYNRLQGLGVRFTQPPTPMGGGGPIIAVFDDTVGNLLQLVQA